MFSIFFLCLFPGSQHFDIVFAATPIPSPPKASNSPNVQQAGRSVSFQLTCSDAGNNVEAYVCKASDCSNCQSGATTNCYCYSGGVASNPSCTYTCPLGQSATNTRYYARCRSTAGQYTTINSSASLIFSCNLPPQWIANTNSSKIASPATYSAGAAYGFQINWTDPESNMQSATFELGRPSGSFTNYTTATIPAVQNIMNTWYINFTQSQLGSVGTYKFTWYATDTTGFQNKSQTIAYMVICPLHYTWNGQDCVLQTGSSDFTINPGWNLISVPCNIISSVMNDQCKISSKPIYSLERGTNKWESHRWDSVIGGRGYWVYSEFNEPCVLSLVCVGDASVLDIPRLRAGYNLIGVASGSPYSLNEIAGECAGKFTKNEALFWDSSTGQWISKSLDSDMIVGKGYWVYVSADCSLSTP